MKHPDTKWELQAERYVRWMNGRLLSVDAFQSARNKHVWIPTINDRPTHGPLGQFVAFRTAKAAKAVAEQHAISVRV